MSASDELDEQFQVYIETAKVVMHKMKSVKDRAIAAEYIKNGIQKMSSTDNLQIKIHRNRFFRYLLKVFKQTVETQDAYLVDANFAGSFDENQEMKQWSPDGKSYVSAKIIPSFGALIYMACSDKPELGWDERGFVNFDDISDAPHFVDLFQNIPLKEPIMPPIHGQPQGRPEDSPGEERNQAEAQA